MSAITVTPGQALLAHVRGILDERWPYRDRGGTKPPQGLRLEMHPVVWYELLTDRTVWQYDGLDRLGTMKAAQEKFGVPLHIMTALAPGTWRLVIITEEVLRGGKMPDGPLELSEETVRLSGAGL